MNLTWNKKGKYNYKYKKILLINTIIAYTHTKITLIEENKMFSILSFKTRKKGHTKKFLKMYRNIYNISLLLLPFLVRCLILWSFSWCSRSHCCRIRLSFLIFRSNMRETLCFLAMTKSSERDGTVWLLASIFSSFESDDTDWNGSVYIRKSKDLMFTNTLVISDISQLKI